MTRLQVNLDTRSRYRAEQVRIDRERALAILHARRRRHLRTWMIWVLWLAGFGGWLSVAWRTW